LIYSFEGVFQSFFTDTDFQDALSDKKKKKQITLKSKLCKRDKTSIESEK
jgi:hypothetical protein